MQVRRSFIPAIVGAMAMSAGLLAVQGMNPKDINDTYLRLPHQPRRLAEVGINPRL